MDLTSVHGYCSICDAEAQVFAPSIPTGLDGQPLRLCGACGTAFVLGQSHPAAKLEDASTEPEPEEEEADI